MTQQRRAQNLFALSAFWFAWEVQWAALLGAAMQGQIARFWPPGLIGTATAVLGGSGAAFSILSQYGFGWLSDKVHRRIPFIIVGTLLDIVAVFGFAWAPSFLLVVITFAAAQISFNAACGPYQALMPDRVVASARGRASAAMGFFRLAGTAVGLFAARLFVHQPGPRVTNAMFTNGLVHLAWAIAIVLVSALIITVLGVKEEPAKLSSLENSEPQYWEHRTSFGWLIASRAAVNMGLYSILPFLAFYLRFVHHIANYLAKNIDLLLIMIASALVGTVPAGVLGDRVSKKLILYIALTLLTLGAVSLSMVQQASVLVPLAIALGIGWGAYYSVDWALACVLLPPGRAGALMAIWNIGASAPQVAAPIVGGLLIDRAGAVSGDLAVGYRLLFALIALFVVLGVIGLIFVREPRAGLAVRTG